MEEVDEWYRCPVSRGGLVQPQALTVQAVDAERIGEEDDAGNKEQACRT
jgi:hypothetical protein